MASQINLRDNSGSPQSFSGEDVKNLSNGMCKAWITFNGYSATATANLDGVADSYNVSSLVDNGTGDYTINFTTAMEDANYCVNIANVANGTTDVRANASIKGVRSTTGATTMTTSSLRVISGYAHASGLLDTTLMCVSIFK